MKFPQEEVTDSWPEIEKAFVKVTVVLLLSSKFSGMWQGDVKERAVSHRSRWSFGYTSYPMLRLSRAKPASGIVLEIDYEPT